MSRAIPRKGYKEISNCPNQQWSRSVGSLGFAILLIHAANLHTWLNRAICSIRREIITPKSFTCCRRLKLEADGSSCTRSVLHLSLRRQEHLLLHDRDPHPEESPKVVSLIHVILRCGRVERQPAVLRMAESVRRLLPLAAFAL
jgi:hypothetical protein